jgi:hypothetical protein
MWWRGQNLDMPRRVATGQVRHVRVWHDFVGGTYHQRIYYWNEERTESGIVPFDRDGTLHVRQLRQRIQRLLSDPAYRGRYSRPLSFPVEQHYGTAELLPDAADTGHTRAA